MFSTNIFRLEHAPASDLDVVFIFKGFKDVSFAERPNNITKRNVQNFCCNFCTTLIAIVENNNNNNIGIQIRYMTKWIVDFFAAVIVSNFMEKGDMYADQNSTYLQSPARIKYINRSRMADTHASHLVFL